MLIQGSYGGGGVSICLPPLLRASDLEYPSSHLNVGIEVDGVVGLLASEYSLKIPMSEGVGRAFSRMSVYRSTEGAFPVDVGMTVAEFGRAKKVGVRWWLVRQGCRIGGRGWI
jgi:hypothetical protein